MRKNAISRVLALVVPVLLSLNSHAFAATGQNDAPVMQSAAVTAPAAVAPVAAAAPAPVATAAPAAAEEEEKPGDLIMHHILDNSTYAFEPFGEVHLPHLSVGGYDISITKPVVMIWLASALLSVTFPSLVFYAEFFKLWPLRKAEAE